MIPEVAVLDVRPGQWLEFERSFAEAGSIKSSMSGYGSHELQRCTKNSDRYLLWVRWDTLEDHTVGFREPASARAGR